MSRVIKFFLWINIHLWLYGCGSFNADPLTHFASHQTKIIKPTKLIPLEDYNVFKPMDVFKYNDDYIITDRKRENVITQINFLTNKFVSGVNYGNGPNELIILNGLLKINDKLCVYDMSQKKIFEIIIANNSIRIEPYLVLNYEKKLAIIKFLGDYVLASGLFADCWIGYVDIENNKLLSGIDFPKFENTSQLQGLQKSVLYLSSHIAIHTNSNKFIVATQDAGIISFSDIHKNDITEYKQIKYYNPLFKVVQGGNIVGSSESKVGFCDLDCDENYIYLLYSGRTFNSHAETKNYCENLLVYDWKGNHVRRYILDIPMWSMKFDREKNSIYGIAYAPEGAFIEYKL